GVDSENPELIAGGPDRQMMARLTPDQTAILFISPKTDYPGGPVSLMRASLNGGVAQNIGELNGYSGHRCSTTALCVLDVNEGPVRIVYKLDPLKGKGPELFRRGAEGPETAVSPDGQHLAYVEGINTIRVVSPEGKPERSIVVKDARFLNALDWAPNGKAFYAGVRIMPAGAALLYVDWDGGSRLLWQHSGSPQTWAIPSPDGKNLAILGATRDSNVWLMEKF
ncbi:MAG: hypothetical protein H7039_23640, partial [Bryobacteraceae bacterium]|nr:hypothetical protein [Bryobacteraceae bacterium]